MSKKIIVENENCIESEKVARLVKEIEEIKIDSLNSFEDWDGFIKTYNINKKEIEKINDGRQTFNNELANIERIYEQALNKYNASSIESLVKLENNVKNKEVRNLGICSAFMTLLIFIFSNILSIYKLQYSIKNIILLNLILLFITSIIFIIIGLFINIINFNNKNKIIKYLLILLIPMFIFCSLIICYFFIKE